MWRPLWEDGLCAALPAWFDQDVWKGTSTSACVRGGLNLNIFTNNCVLTFFMTMWPGPVIVADPENFFSLVFNSHRYSIVTFDSTLCSTARSHFSLQVLNNLARCNLPAFLFKTDFKRVGALCRIALSQYIFANT
jgi:hypothetical protein